jgi:hypothetical protein
VPFEAAMNYGGEKVKIFSENGSFNIKSQF